MCFNGVDMPGWEYCPGHGRRVGERRNWRSLENAGWSSELQPSSLLEELLKVNTNRNYKFTLNLRVQKN